MLTVDPGLVVVALQMSVGGQAAKVLVSLPVLGQQNEMEGLAICLAFLVAHAPPGHVSLDANDRLHALGGDGLDERDGSIPVSYTHLRAHETRHDLVCRLL